MMNAIVSFFKAALIAAGLIAALSLTSCNTMAGLGRDIGNAGTGLENAASH